MTNKTLAIVCGTALLSLAATACKKSDDKSAPKADVKADPAKPVTPAAPPANAKPKVCADYKGTGKGDFGDSCKVAGPAPFDVVVTDGWKDDFGDKRTDVKITNKTDHETDWGSITIWYYDKDGKPLHVMSDDGKSDLGTYWNMNGSGELNMKPGETLEVAVGPKQGSEPAGFAKKEVEVTGWGWDGPNNADTADKGALFFDPHSDITDLDFGTRPEGGWKAGAAPAAPAAPAAQ